MQKVKILAGTEKTTVPVTIDWMSKRKWQSPKDTFLHCVFSNVSSNWFFFRNLRAADGEQMESAVFLATNYLDPRTGEKEFKKISD